MPAHSPKTNFRPPLQVTLEIEDPSDGDYVLLPSFAGRLYRTYLAPDFAALDPALSASTDAASGAVRYSLDLGASPAAGRGYRATVSTLNVDGQESEQAPVEQRWAPAQLAAVCSSPPPSPWPAPSPSPAAAINVPKPSPSPSPQLPTTAPSPSPVPRGPPRCKASVPAGR